MYFKKVWRILRVATFCAFASAGMGLFFGCSQSSLETPQSSIPQAKEKSQAESLAPDSAQAPIIIKLSFVGDCVLGDYKGASGATFNAKFKEVGGDYAYFSKGVVAVLSEDDLSVANLEGVLSDKELQNAFVKPFSFKGKSVYTNILKAASIESVNIANNHTRDYGAQGFKDTREILQNAEIPYFGEGFLDIREIKGKKFGFGAHRGWSRDIKSRVKDEIARLRQSGAEVVIFTFHWGEEREHIANSLQREIAHFAIDNGADLIIGHHPHVLQGIEEYKGKKIVYSLGNFIYGGAKNPKDKDTMIYRVEFAFYENPNDAKSAYARIVGNINENAESTIRSIPSVDFWEDSSAVLKHSIIPANISSQNAYNDYSPRIYEKNSAEYERVLKRVEEYSTAKVPEKAR
ncbi:capsular biosynthesis protein [Helicobacter sp. MIT 00-7814]|uniref:CapA family protein n=1 Tax=unclassified Helicobacter TaxID=2593540 RepID=UPI000E1E3954|nr:MULTISPECIES: CapA family protein [unclassified Helicobacter]RDU53453.1 capsular biosynthesis protein [Helicobacter sp. MIT 99-10781]RDU53750.1 capsular biosynthesis protein [Helicobacter sp. MIT 00-7814]